jgi:hypothetical protein
MPRTEIRDTQLTLRIPKRLRVALERDADAQRRTLADVMCALLERQYGAAPAPKKGR